MLRLPSRILVSSLLACALATTAQAKVVVVNMRDNFATSSFFFDPAYIVVSRGDTVRWVNAGATVHTSTSAQGFWDSGLLSPGQSFQRQMMETGPHQYFCAPHQSLGMIGAVSVITHTVKSVSMNDNFATQSFFFSPSSVTASPGDTIKWTNVGATVHTATSGEEETPGAGVLFNSPFMNPGAVFRWVVKDTTGTIPYFCLPHGSLGMVGSITIQPTSVAEPGGRGDAGMELSVRMLDGGRSSAIAFTVPQAGPVRVSVLDARGAVVLHLVDGQASAGRQQLVWNGLRADGSHAPAGVYFYDVRVGERHAGRSGVLLR